MDIGLVLVTIILLMIIYILFLRHDPSLPPRPAIPLPVVGHLLILQEDSRVQLKKWRQELGDIFSIYFGRKLAVVINGYDLLKEVLVKKGDECLDRSSLFLDDATGIPGKGVIMSNGHEWKEQRSVMLSILRSFGLGKNILAEKILEEALHYTEVLAGLQGKPTDIRVTTNISMSNIVCSIIIGQRFQHDDKIFQELMTTIDSIVHDFPTSNYATYIPFLKYLPGDFFKTKRTQSSARKVMNEFVKKFVDSKSKELADDDDNDNFIAAYIRELKQKTSSEEDTTMSKDNLSKIIWDLFNAGTETAATTILWCLLYILNYPEVQDKIYSEIEANIGTERVPGMQDKPRLVYLNAFIMESQRLASVAALPFPRVCSSDMTVGKYTLPKGTMIIPNLDSVAYDEKIWGEYVDTLRPERFIDENGKLKNPEEFIPFGIGRRACPGESWAKMVLFLFLSTMFQRFKFLPTNPASPPPIDYIFGIDVCPVPFEVRIVDRRKEN